MRFEKIAAVCRRPRTQGVFQIVHHDGERHHVGKNTHKIKYGRLPNQHDKIVKEISAANVLQQFKGMIGCHVGSYQSNLRSSQQNGKVQASCL